MQERRRMTKIAPEVLKKLRETKGWSQAELAGQAKFDTQTIWRLERGKQKTTRLGTVAKLARVLGVESAVLTGDAPIPDVTPAPQKSSSNNRLSTRTENALYLIARRYNVPGWQVLELAPLLFCWAAEMSLRERRERLRKLEAACSTARALEDDMAHLPPSNFTYSDEKIRAESESIDFNDIFGTCIDGDQFLDGPYYPDADDTDNPFAKFLDKLMGDISDVVAFNGFSPFDYPDYKVCRDHALRLVGGDELLAERILTGIVDLAEMPKELGDFFAKSEDRIAWVKAKADEFIDTQIRFHEQRKVQQKMKVPT